MTAFGRRHALTYWRTLLGVASGMSVLHDTLDIPLDEAVVRSRWMAGWTIAICLLTAGILRPSFFTWLANRLSLPHVVSYLAVILLCSMGLALSIVLAYGFLRLYTLVGHVLTINVFKARGQRLRLLNLQSTLLPLSAPICVGAVVTNILPWLGWCTIGCSILYGIVMLAFGYNLIFHKKQLGGLALLIGGTLVTWFVLLIGALAISVTAAVLVFFALAILRLFVRHVSP